MANYLGATGISVGDLKRAVDFYTRVLGMKQTATFSLANMEEAVMGFDRGSAIVLMQYTDGVARDHAAFAGKLVFYFDDVKAVIEGIREEGLEIVREPAKSDFGPALIAFAKDPDGYVLELLQALAKK